MVPDKDRSATERRIFPNEARERLTSYRAKLAVRIKWAVTGDDGEEATYEETKDCGLLPVMVKVSKQVWKHVVVVEIAYISYHQSNRCNLKGMSSAQLVGRNEESSSWGGYFIVNGNEKLIRYRE